MLPLLDGRTVVPVSVSMRRLANGDARRQQDRVFGDDREPVRAEVVNPGAEDRDDHGEDGQGHQQDRDFAEKRARRDLADDRARRDLALGRRRRERHLIRVVAQRHDAPVNRRDTHGDFDRRIRRQAEIGLPCEAGRVVRRAELKVQPVFEIVADQPNAQLAVAAVDHGQLDGAGALAIRDILLARRQFTDIERIIRVDGELRTDDRGAIRVVGRCDRNAEEAAPGAAGRQTRRRDAHDHVRALPLVQVDRRWIDLDPGRLDALHADIELCDDASAVDDRQWNLDGLVDVDRPVARANFDQDIFVAAVGRQ